jgi:X-X-X-Leu-X-X-Gly heptad repeat protein
MLHCAKVGGHGVAVVDVPAVVHSVVVDGTATVVVDGTATVVDGTATVVDGTATVVDGTVTVVCCDVVLKVGAVDAAD